MKLVKSLFLSAAVFLAAAALGGCSNPIPAISPDAIPGLEQTAEAESDRETPLQAPDLKPFTVTLTIDGDGSARSVVGPTAGVIGGGKGLLNFIQLVVVDPENQADPIHGLADGRQPKAANTEVALTINKVQYQKDYEFLYLMGYWERDYANGEDNDNHYVYKEDAYRPCWRRGIRRRP
jgi:hypothetical protein